MPHIIIIEKSGAIKELSVRDFSEDQLYKKAGFKTADDFTKHTSWKVVVQNKSYIVDIYGKITGRAGQENKYDFPPPIDNTLFFGSCVLVNRLPGGGVSDLSAKEWNSIYEELFGGFEDIGDEDTDEDEDDDDDPDGEPRTKEGYVKDGFIVDDDEEDEDEDEEEDEDEDEDDDDGDDDDEDDDGNNKKKSKTKTRGKIAEKKKVSKSTQKSKPKSMSKSNKKTIPETVFLSANEKSQESFLDCTSELEEEEYFA
jgi:hypothetical protein